MSPETVWEKILQAEGEGGTSASSELGGAWKALSGRSSALWFCAQSLRHV